MSTDPVSNWDINDIPMMVQPKVTTNVGLQGEIEQITEVLGQQERYLIQTRSDHIRNALIDMGWTPPDEYAEPESILGEEFRAAWGRHLQAMQLLVRDPKTGDQWHQNVRELPLKDLWALIACLDYNHRQLRERVHGAGQATSVQPEVSDPDDQGELQQSERPGGVSLESLLEQAQELAGSKEGS
jgi:hypothetical protein